jgi:hypothetical protein
MARANQSRAPLGHEEYHAESILSRPGARPQIPVRTEALNGIYVRSSTGQQMARNGPPVRGSDSIEISLRL